MKEWFENELKIVLPKNKQTIVSSDITIAKSRKEYDKLEASIKSILEGVSNNKLALE